MIVFCGVGMTILVFQCQRLIRLLRATSEHKSHSPNNFKDLTASLRGNLRSSSSKSQAELAQEIQSVSQMQQEVTSQLAVLKTILAQLEETRAPDEGEELPAEDSKKNN
jgi:HPt (histidine-containing phosphotransfer) domain-containing protein